MPATLPYIGRFAPSPTGPLHAGSLVAALASWLDARAHGGRWLVRIEDVDTPRCRPEHGEHLLVQLAEHGLMPDAPPLWQSRQTDRYEAALAQLRAAGLSYPCHCSRQDIQRWHTERGHVRARHAEWPYPGTCRPRGDAPPDLTARRATPAWRLRLGADTTVHWCDRRLGERVQEVAHTVGDFVLRRADGCWAYQLAVVVDDGVQGVTHVVRGEDLEDNTPRQLLLQTALGLPRPLYLHTPLKLDEQGEKLSKQTGAAALTVATPDDALRNLRAAAGVLGLAWPGLNTAQPLPDWLAQAVGAWQARWGGR